jgi:hypothetical protein
MPRWSFLRIVASHFNVKGSSARIYGRGEARLYVEILFLDDSDDPRVQLWAFAGKEADVSNEEWVKAQFKHRSWPIPLDVLAHIAKDPTEAKKVKAYCACGAPSCNICHGG